MEYGRSTTEYLCWLMNRIGLEAEGDKGYLQLCITMQNTDFVPILEMDENRSADCMQLREEFASSSDPENRDILDYVYGEGGTMLELLIVLAEKMSYQLSDSEFEAAPRKWFLELLGNCGIDELAQNEKFKTEGNRDRIVRILRSVIFRDIDWGGDRGLFPLMYPQRDQRKVELLMQMNDYISENYDIC